MWSMIWSMVWVVVLVIELLSFNLWSSVMFFTMMLSSMISMVLSFFIIVLQVHQFFQKMLFISSHILDFCPKFLSFSLLLYDSFNLLLSKFLGFNLFFLFISKNSFDLLDSLVIGLSFNKCCKFGFGRSNCFVVNFDELLFTLKFHFILS